MPLSAKWFKLDRDYTLLDAGVQAPPTFNQNTGRNLWDIFGADAQQTFRPVYEAAWETGHAAKLVYWDHVLTDLRAVVVDDTLLVYWTSTTLAGLEDALEKIMADCAA